MAGVMAEIRKRLSEGESAQELIGAGYKSGSVFKAQWQLRKQGLIKSSSQFPESAQSNASKGSLTNQSDSEKLERFKSELESTNAIIDLLVEEILERGDAISQLKDRISELEAAI